VIYFYSLTNVLSGKQAPDCHVSVRKYRKSEVSALLPCTEIIVLRHDRSFTRHASPLLPQLEPAMADQKAAFGDLPAEIVQSILFYLPPENLCDVRATSKQLQAIADTPLLWRYHCRIQYRFWDPVHSIARKLASPVSSTEWKELFITRRRIDATVHEQFDAVVRSPQNRIYAIEDVTLQKYGSTTVANSYDVKDALLSQYNVGEDQEDHLARKYWAEAILGRLHRALAIQEWKKLRHETVALERALGSYDMFIVGAGDGDYNDIHADLDSLASAMLELHPHFDELSTRRKALTISEFLQSKNFTGVSSEEDYHNLQNNFMSRVLRDPEHEALPLICVAIYCCIASRANLNARPCGFPLHVYAVVSAPEGQDLDGREMPPDAMPERMYVDPFRSAADVPVSQLQSELRRMGIGSFADDLYLGPAGTLEITVRTGRNIMNSVKIIQDNAQDAAIGADIRTPAWTTVNPDLDASFYATLWATCLLHDHSSAGNQRRRHYLPFICEHFQLHFPWDAQLIKDHIAPLFHGFPEYNHLVEIINGVKYADRNPRVPVPRSENTATWKVKYRVGDVFRHRRYGYEGIVVGWDTCCDAGETWINQMGVDRLDGGRGQSFYHVLYVILCFPSILIMHSSNSY
jgi:F-box protein 21